MEKRQREVVAVKLDVNHVNSRDSECEAPAKQPHYARAHVVIAGALAPLRHGGHQATARSRDDRDDRQQWHRRAAPPVEAGRHAMAAARSF